jgi:hypothetical protein
LQRVQDIERAPAHTPLSRLGHEAGR